VHEGAPKIEVGHLPPYSIDSRSDGLPDRSAAMKTAKMGGIAWNNSTTESCSARVLNSRPATRSTRSVKTRGRSSAAEPPGRQRTGLPRSQAPANDRTCPDARCGGALYEGDSPHRTFRNWLVCAARGPPSPCGASARHLAIARLDSPRAEADGLGHRSSPLPSERRWLLRLDSNQQPSG
jgi:hypothetical protein